MAGVKFSEGAARRIVDAVREVERFRPSPRNKRRRFVTSYPRGAVFVRVQATEDGYGKYSGVVLTAPSAPTGINDVVSQADLGDEGEACYIINALERDRAAGDNSGHDLSMIEGDRPKDFLAIYLYPDPDDDTPTYGIVGFQVADCEDTNTLII